MTISSTNTQDSYSGNGSTTAFAVTFKYLAKADISVTVVDITTGSKSDWVLDTDYTLTAPGDSGTLTATTAPASGESLVLNRVMALTQGTDYVENDAFPAESHEEALDRTTMLAQQNANQLGGVRPSLVVTDNPSLTFDELASARANKLLSFDSAGDLDITQEIGVYKGTDATTTTVDYSVRDLVKSTTTAQLNNIYICTATSAVGTALTNTSYWALIIDAVAAGSSATAAAASAAAAQSSEDDAAADLVLTNADVVLTNADTVATAADRAAVAAAAFADGVLASSYQFTGTGSQVAFTITGGVTDIPNAQALIITIDGVTQHTDTYTVSGKVVTFSVAPPLNGDIQVRYNAYLGDALVSDFTETIVTMKALSPAVNSSINLLGYYARGDGGGGVFYWDATSTATDNGGTIIKAAPATGRWLRVYEGALNIKWFGAKGDGVAGDAAANKAIFDTVIALGQTIDLDGGTYYTTGFASATTVYLTSKGDRATINNSSATDSLITLGTDPYIEITNVNLISSGASTGYAIVGLTATCRHFLFRDGRIQGHKLGIMITDGLDGVIENLYLEGQGKTVAGGIGLQIGNADGVARGTTWTIKDVYFTSFETLAKNYAEGSLFIRPIFEVAVTGLISNARGSVMQPYFANIDAGKDLIIGDAVSSNGLFITGYGSQSNGVTYFDNTSKVRTTIISDSSDTNTSQRIFGRRMAHGNAIPVADAWDTGDVLLDYSGDKLGWICTVAGTPGSWQELPRTDIGTWTPSIGGDATYTNQVGTYIRVGDLVHLYFQLQINVLGTGSTTTISGIPTALTNRAVRAAGDLSYWNASAVNLLAVNPYVESAGTTIKFCGAAAAATGITLDYALFGASTQVIGSITYQREPT